MIFSGYHHTIPIPLPYDDDDDDSRLVLPLVRFLPTYEYVRLTFARMRHKQTTNNKNFFRSTKSITHKKIISETTIDRPWHCL